MRALSAEEYLELSRDDVNRAVEKIIEGFDFDRAASALKGCDWKYEGAENSPSADELRVIGLDILRSAIQSGCGCKVSRGPLRASVFTYDTPTICTATLTLEPIWKSEVYIDARAIYAKGKQKFTSAKKAVKK